MGSHWLIDADSMERPDTGPLLAASVHARRKPSYKPRKPLQLTPEEAHVMWGHAGRLAIDHLPGSVDGLDLVDGNSAPKCRLVNNQAACKRLIDSLITINPIKSSLPILIF
jgi:hypothetical protein